MSQNDFRRQTGPNPVGERAGNNGLTIAAIIVVAVLVAGLLIWSPWRSGPQTASTGPASTSTVHGTRPAGTTGTTGETGSGAQGG